MLRRYPAPLQQLFTDLAGGSFIVGALDASSFEWIARFMQQYADLPAQLADAALMYLAEREGIDAVFTLDRRDFSVYRLRNGRSVTVIPH